MKAAYLVIEGKENVKFLQSILPVELLQETEIVGTGSEYAALSLAGTIMAKRSRPIILVVDAHSDDPAQVQETRETLESLLLPAASSSPYKVFLAIPSLGAIVQEFGQDLDNEQRHQLQSHPLIQQIIAFLSNLFSQVA